MVREKVLTPLEIYKVLEQSNCKRCMLPSCLAFAAAVISGQKKLDDCPMLTEEEKVNLSATLQKRSTATPEQSEFMVKLLEKIQTIEFSHRAPEIGAKYVDEHLHVVSLGKVFRINAKGEMRSECHIIPWVQAPLLSYVCHPTHQSVTGTWSSCRELNGGIEWQGLFTSRCEAPLRQLADANPDLLADIVDLFMAEEVEGFDADIALVLYPFPHIPILICYQMADGDLDSELTIFFDECCGSNLHIKSIYTLVAGLVKMFENIAKNHY